MRRTAVFALVLVAVVAGAGLAAAKPSPSTSVTISTSTNRVVYGSQVTVSGQASGKGAGAARVTLYAEPAPSYRTPKAVATATTSAGGQYKFTTAPAQGTIYFVRVHTTPQATSPQAKVLVKVAVSLRLTGGAGHMFFTGSVLPNYSGKQVSIERRTAHGWKQVATARLRAASSVSTALGTTTRSKYRKRLRLKSGTYRVFFDPNDGLRIANHSRKHRI